MRRFVLLPLSLALLTVPLIAQPQPRRPVRYASRAEAIELAVRNATEQFANEKKAIERDTAVLRHLRAADTALTDAMQPTNAIQKAYEEVDAAHGLGPEFTVAQGVIQMRDELDAARRSPGSADFNHLRGLLRKEAIGPAVRLVVRNSLRLQEETVAWLKVEQLIGDHLRAISDLSSDALRATDEP
jgi:Arc/MetJ-type ribon-helix-helix transcriptional regulator